ncbi:hypothetical protein FB567DRAFT_590411 [Paraphoma chrysanthemicola]|uniref:Uncharacterized protein n=1 Tax=Paraphoma chrysanthemicola TaxID=798071 RepID=A0A8K0W177_9PLEO|nr:hypothetical protein FB567DRAFT_590411 [Paraphoma chrysanthemicola]
MPDPTPGDELQVLPYATNTTYPCLRIEIGWIFALLLLIGGNVVTFSSTLVGPLMGITSLLWLMLRNDPAISPKASWMVFGAWSLLTLAYFMVQCHRVSNHRIYVLLTIAMASVCACLIALVQKSSLQSGSVTIIPPCTSFAAYCVAYFFPKRQRTIYDVETGRN